MARFTGIRASVIVPAYNAADTLPACIEALLRQSVPREDYEVIVVDDGSTDATAQVADRPGVIAVRQPHRGPAAARNTGIQVALGRVLLFTDADCVPAPNWIERMFLAFADPAVAGCKGIYCTRQSSPVARFVQAEYEEKYRRMEKAVTIDFVDTYSAAYRKEVLLREGVFDEDIPVPSVEDIELSFRLAGRGHRLIFNPGGVVYHRHPVSVGHYARRKFRYGVWRWHVYRRYPEKLTGDSHTPKSLRWQLLGVAAMLLSVPLCPLVPWAKWVLLVSALGFAATTASFVLRLMRRDPLAAVLAPFMLWVRALALGLGLSYGILRHYGDQLFSRVSLQKHAR